MIRVVIGLGNPGRRYHATRHNVGALVVEELARRRDATEAEEMAQCLVHRLPREGEPLVLARPDAFMNVSGPAVRALLKRFDADPGEALVVTDDLHLEFGVLRLRREGSHGGHNGLRSLIDALGTTGFPRLRIGIGEAPEGIDQADYVLERFAPAERARLPEVIGAASDCVEMAIEAGLECSMNHCNRKPDVASGPDAGTE